MYGYVCKNVPCTIYMYKVPVCPQIIVLRMHFSSEKENMTCQILMLIRKWSTYKKMCATNSAAFVPIFHDVFGIASIEVSKFFDKSTYVVVNSIRRLPNLIIRNCAHRCENMPLLTAQLSWMEFRSSFETSAFFTNFGEGNLLKLNVWPIFSFQRRREDRAAATFSFEFRKIEGLSFSRFHAKHFSCRCELSTTKMTKLMLPRCIKSLFTHFSSLLLVRPQNHIFQKQV